MSLGLFTQLMLSQFGIGKINTSKNTASNKNAINSLLTNVLLRCLPSLIIRLYRDRFDPLALRCVLL